VLTYAEVDERMLTQVMRRTNRVAKAMLTERQKEPAEAVPKELTCGLTGAQCPPNNHG
jgi:ACT domain-containing protein